MATKTWKIGEYAKGGIITVETTSTKVIVIAKDWDFSTGSRRSSDQSNAKEFNRKSVVATDNGSKRAVLEFLEDLTTSYYAGQIMEWINTKIKLSTAGDGWYW